jgi:hypothetical protein
MTINEMTLYNYINTNSSENIIQFKKVFKNEIEKLPNKIVSSKIMMQYLNLDTDDYYKHMIFNKLYMEYFKKFLTEKR